MTYFQVLFTPVTGQAFLATRKDVVGFKTERREYAEREVSEEDVLLCRMTKLARWFAALEVTSNVYECDSPICGENGLPLFTQGPDSCEPAHDLYKVRFKAKKRVVIDDLAYAVPHGEIPVSVPVRGNFVAVDDSAGECLVKLLRKNHDHPVCRPLRSKDVDTLARARRCGT